MFSLPMNVQRSIIINKPIADIFSILTDFHSWQHWSPWLCQEPDCPIKFSGEAGVIGHSQAWDGERIGAGKMVISSFAEPTRIEYELTFLKPWKSTSKVIFELAEENQNTNVTWHMQGSIPLFLFFMRKTMTAMIGSDYDRGLSMLKAFAETGVVNSKLEVVGEVSRQGFSYVGHRKSCTIEEIGPQMEKDFSNLHALLEEGKLPAADFCFSFYHNFDFVERRCEYTAGVAYHTPPSQSIAELDSGNISPHKALQLNHIGAYDYLANGWSTLYGLLRAKKRKASKTVPMYEIYKNFPGEVDDAELTTELFMPIRH